MKIMQVDCEPDCGFSIKSRDIDEILSVVKHHAKKYHNMEISDEKISHKIHLVEVEI